MPFPDEPPIRFPDSAYIKSVTKLRYGASGSQFDNWKDFSEIPPERQARTPPPRSAPEDIGRALEYQKKLNERIDYELLVQTTLDKVLDELLTRQGIPWTVNEAAFVAAHAGQGPRRKTEVDKIDKMERASAAPRSSSGCWPRSPATAARARRRT